MCLSLSVSVSFLSLYLCISPSHSLCLNIFLLFPLFPCPPSFLSISLSHPPLFSLPSFFPSSPSFFCLALSFARFSLPLALSPCFSVFVTLHPFFYLSVFLCLCHCVWPPSSSHHIAFLPLCLPVVAVPACSPCPAEAEFCEYLGEIKVL